MENEKENLRKLTKISRIPIPLDPLPAIPNHLLRREFDEKVDTVRKPLATINQGGDNVTSSSGVKKNNERLITKRIIKININNVTVRQKNEYLDSDHNVFKDLDENVITINDYNQEETQDFPLADDDPIFLSENRLPITPVVPIQPIAVRNVKKSLKRPHSRELLGVTFEVIQDKSKVEEVKRRLKFNEKINQTLQSPDHWNKSYMTCLDRDYTSDIFEYLLSIEKMPLGVPYLKSNVRACVINWLVRVNRSDGNPAIVQSACWYLDSILSKSKVPIEKIQLKAAACFWIAQKLHGPVSLSKGLVTASNNAFSAIKLIRAEKSVMEKLAFPIQPIVPQEFITYLSWWCDSAHPGPIEVAATFLCMSALMVNKITCAQFPSVIAAAAVKTALELTRKRDLLDRLKQCPTYQQAEKKTSSMTYVSGVLRSAVCTISTSSYEYKSLLEQYGGPPHYTAQEITNAAFMRSISDTRRASMDI